MIVEEKSQKNIKRVEEVARDMHLALLREGIPISLNTSSSSMHPFLKGGDTVKILPVKEEDMRIGDVIAVVNENKNQAWFYAHRLVRIFTQDGARRYVTKGDANQINLDEPVGFKRIAGKVAAVDRNGLRIDLESPLWKRLNSYIAKVSLKYPKRLRLFSPWISIIIEWRWFFLKLRRKINAPLSNTEELILICARTHIDSGLLKRAKGLLGEEIDWDLFLQAALNSGLSLLFYNSLKITDYNSLVPKDLFITLKNSYLYSIPKTTFMYQEAKELLNILFKNNIPAMPFKGPFLSKRLYGDIAARGPSVDFDFLVEEKNKESARRLLEEAGYLFVPESEGMRWNQQWVFRKKDDIIAELHWGIRPDAPSRERMPGFWNGARQKCEDEVCFYELAEEELLIMLSAHFIGSAHLGQLRYICDINELLTQKSNKLDWQAIVEKSKRWRLSNSVYAMILLSKTLFQTPIPEGVLIKLKPCLLKRLLIRIFLNSNKSFGASYAGRRFIAQFLTYILLQALEINSIKDFIALVFPPREIMGGKTYIRRLYNGIQKLSSGFFSAKV